MSLGAIIERVERHERRLTLLSPPSRAVVSAVERTFAPQGVRVDVEEGTDHPTAMVRDGERVVSTVPLAGDDAGLEATTDALVTALSTLDRTTFASYDLRGMVAATREIEDRAWRVGRGRLRAGFQHVRALSDQRPVYRQLATVLDVHTYAVPDGPPPDLGDAVVHLDPAPEIERSWFVVYDGGGSAANKCALLAEERDDRQFSGFLTYAPDLVDEIDDYLATAY
ncbi:DICT sensory domain-containing protein [Salinigranum salinum]|uniref:DICT sensory domain-containing protein n=1 Tax=Salinigranum salinum TaxID=1364937 RepID=UPI0012611A71|nr:DICT sensory domain-containing protein [Salinigranum salinum]